MTVRIAATDLRDKKGGSRVVPAASRDAFSAPHQHVDDFLPADLAAEMREAIDDHFGDPYKHGEDRQVWNYWFVPGLYTYLRTAPEKVIPNALVDRFHAALTAWSFNVLGMGLVTRPLLSLYVDGCGQGLHNDSANGRFGYVYSLTRNDRETRGGETIVLKEGDLFRNNLTAPSAGYNLYDLIEPIFNRLAVFDDRMPHGVERVYGSMNPAQGRLVLHGHISETGAGTRGALTPAEVGAVVEDAANEVLSGWVMSCDPHGPLVVRVSIAASGQVEQVRLMLDRVAFPDGSSAEGLADLVVDELATRSFPARTAPTEAIVPILLGGPLPPRR